MGEEEIHKGNVKNVEGKQRGVEESGEVKENKYKGMESGWRGAGVLLKNQEVWRVA